MCATALREVRGQLLELVHSFPFNVGSRDRTLVARLVWQAHVTSPKLDICFCFLDRVSLCSSGWPELTKLALNSQVLGLKVYTTRLSSKILFLKFVFIKHFI